MNYRGGFFALLFFAITLPLSVLFRKAFLVDLDLGFGLGFFTCFIYYNVKDK